MKNINNYILEKLEIDKKDKTQQPMQLQPGNQIFTIKFCKEKKHYNVTFYLTDEIESFNKTEITFSNNEHYKDLFINSNNYYEMHDIYHDNNDTCDAYIVFIDIDSGINFLEEIKKYDFNKIPREIFKKYFDINDKNIFDEKQRIICRAKSLYSNIEDSINYQIKSLQKYKNDNK